MVPTIRDAWLGRAPRWTVTASGDAQAERFLDVLLRSPVPLDPYRIVVFATCDSKPAVAFTDALRRRVVDQRLPKWVQQIRVVDVPRALADSDYYLLDRHLRASGHVKIARLLAPDVVP
jgi:hypothetical protein